MTRAQALALSTALAGQKIKHALGFSYDAAGAETANVTLDPAITYTGDQLAQLTTYCASHGLTLTLVMAQMGVT